MVLKVPQVVGNGSSLGDRRFQTQKIKGTLVIEWK